MSLILWKAIDPFKREIILLRSTWEEHVLNPEFGHPELRGYELYAKEAIEAPNLIVQSAKVPTSDIYIKLGAIPVYLHLYLRIPVNFADDKYGKVSTVMLTRSKDLFQGTAGIGGIKYGRLK